MENPEQKLAAMLRKKTELEHPIRLDTTTNKENLLRTLVDDGDGHVVYLNPAHEKAIVPNRLRQYNSLNITLRDYQNLEIDQNGLTIGFKDQDVDITCVFPWDALWGIRHRNGRSVMWTRDTPLAVLDLDHAHQATLTPNALKAFIA